MLSRVSANRKREMKRKRSSDVGVSDGPLNYRAKRLQCPRVFFRPDPTRPFISLVLLYLSRNGSLNRLLRPPSSRLFSFMGRGDPPRQIVRAKRVLLSLLEAGRFRAYIHPRSEILGASAILV